MHALPQLQVGYTTRDRNGPTSCIIFEVAILLAFDMNGGH